VEQEALDGPAAYAPAEFLASVRRGVWREVESPQVTIDAYRRQLQRAYLDLANTKINGSAPSVPAGLPSGFSALFASSGDEKAFYRAELRTLNSSISGALGRTADRETRAHLEGARDQIAHILDPKFGPAAGSGLGELRIFGNDWSKWSGTLAPSEENADGAWDRVEDCWPDYAIRP
jgi:autotransporter translocation and assembly factor TamB